MPVRAYLVCLWPGLPQLWYRGVWQGLVPAILFALFLNLLLVARLVYPQWLSPVAVRVGCWLLVGLWLATSVRAIRSLPRLLAPRLVEGVKDVFPDAQENFLAGRWFEAERLLRECLEIDSRDASAWLQLAAVYRITGRLEESQEAIERLRSLETGSAWWMEIAAEEQRLRAAVESREEAQEEDAEAKSPTGEKPPAGKEIRLDACRNGNAARQVEAARA